MSINVNLSSLVLPSFSSDDRELEKERAKIAPAEVKNSDRPAIIHQCHFCATQGLLEVQFVGVNPYMLFVGKPEYTENGTSMFNL